MPFFDQYDEELSVSERELVVSARALCSGPFSQAVHTAYLLGEPVKRDWIGQWAAAGMLGLQAKPEHGGQGASFLCKIRVAQEMARHSFAAAFCFNNLQGQATRISRSGSPVQQERLLAGLMDGSILAAPSMSEPSGGSDLGSLTTSATAVDGGWLVNGKKAWISNGTIVDCLTMLVRMGDQGDLANLLVPLGEVDTDRREENDMPGARGFRLAQIKFTDHFVPDWGLLNAPGEAVRASMAAVNAARVHVAAMCVATLHGVLCDAVAYGRTRTTFGKPLLGHQGLQWQLAEVATRLEAANTLVFRAAYLIDRGRPALTIAAQAKKFAVDTAIWGVDQCIRSMGAIGASASHRLSMQLDEVRLAAFADGTNEMMLDRIGRGLAKDYDAPPGGVSGGGGS